MKKFFIVSLVLLLSFPVFVQGGEVLVKINGLGSDKGKLSLGLFKKENFPETGKEFRGANISADSANLKYEFEEVPPGKYAVSLFHDKNSDGKLNKTIFGIPKEGYGFSSNAYNWYGGVPEFKEASFTVKEEEKVKLSINVKNWPPAI